jgi:GT2 family glycosyltransferase
MTDSLPCLAVVPMYLRNEQDLDIVLRCLVSLRQTAPEVEVLVVDDCSPAAQLVDLIEIAAEELEIELCRLPVNGGFARAVNADIVFDRPGWLAPMLARTDTTGALAGVVGARLLSPNGLLQHAGFYYSTLTRNWAHRLRFGPADLPEALVPLSCPVTAALQLIRHECLAAVGVYDENFRMGYEDVDYCLRVFASGRECVYEPATCATHAEGSFRTPPPAGQEGWEEQSLLLLNTKYPITEMTGFRPCYE